jgi:hypothetical protein
MDESIKAAQDVRSVRYKVGDGPKVIVASRLGTWGRAQERAMVEANRLGKALKLTAREQCPGIVMDEQGFMVVPTYWEVHEPKAE